MNLLNYAKKALILFLLLLAVASVYIIKNDESRDKCLDSLKSIVWKAGIFGNFAQNEEADIEMEDINLENLIEEGNSEDSVETATEEKNEPVPARVAEKKEVSLESIQEEVNGISVKISQLEREVENLKELVRLQKQMQEIARQIEALTSNFGQAGTTV